MEKKITFEFEFLPENLEKLKEIKESELKNPFETAALTVLALLEYENNKENTLEMINYLKGPQLLNNYEIQFLKDRLTNKGYIPKSYFEGTSPENNYKLNKPYKITVFENKYSYEQKGYVKLYLKSSGADSPRPIVLRSKGQNWYLWEQMLLADIRQPDSSDPWK